MWSVEERDALRALPSSVRRIEAQETAVVEGESSRRLLIVASGLVSRQKKVDVRSRIFGFCFPGEAVNLSTIVSDKAGCSVVAHRPTTLLVFAAADVSALIDRYPAIARALWRDTLVDAAILQEWTVNIGHRRALERIGHLLLEIEVRLNPLDAAANDAFDLPVNQIDLANALGLSLVHFNKSLSALRRDGLISIKGRKVRIQDRSALARLACFEESYLARRAPSPFARTGVLTAGRTQHPGTAPASERLLGEKTS